MRRKKLEPLCTTKEMVEAGVKRVVVEKDRSIDINALVDKFLAWPLPASVCVDTCALERGYPHRSGTNLLTASEAKQMLEYLLCSSKK